jgi:hypothetical protein
MMQMQGFAFALSRQILLVPVFISLLILSSRLDFCGR